MRLNALDASKMAACKVKFSLLRYRAFRQAASLGCALRFVKDYVYLWPIFSVNEETELEVIKSNVVHFLHNLNTPVVFFQRNQMEITRNCYSVETGSITSRRVISETKASNELRRARYCVKWKYEGRPRANSLHPWLYCVAEGPDCHGTTDWLRLVSDLYLEQHLIPNRVSRIPEKFVRTCAVLGTGPSLDHFMNESERWDAWIGANTVVCDERIFSKGRPFAFCTLDPSVFGPTYHWKSMWAGAFRLLRESPAVLITTKDFAPYIELNFPNDIREKCHYVKTLGHDSYRMMTRFDLSDLTVTPYGNVLTDLMLPLASSMTRRVILYGCDGRPPDVTLNFPKCAALQKYDDAWLEDGPAHVDECFYSKYMDKHSLYTRYVVDECINHGVRVTLRCPSWNVGLAGLPVYSPGEE